MVKKTQSPTKSRFSLVTGNGQKKISFFFSMIPAGDSGCFPDSQSYPGLFLEYFKAKMNFFSRRKIFGVETPLLNQLFEDFSFNFFTKKNYENFRKLKKQNFLFFRILPKIRKKTGFFLPPVTHKWLTHRRSHGFQSVSDKKVRHLPTHGFQSVSDKKSASKVSRLQTHFFFKVTHCRRTFAWS